ncbi:MAG: TonB-dependent receptor [Gemmatimonadaceae bacterium]|nr:TonB-dependent receptor [Gemmatimonadaceae bacterium]
MRSSGARWCRVALVGMLVVPAVLRAQGETGTIRGKVTNAAGAPVPNAQVFVANSQLGAAAGADGAYSIARVPAGNATVRVRMIGYEPTDRQVAVVAGQVVTVDFTLRTSAVSLDQVVVTGTAGSARKREIGNSIGQVKASDLPEVPTNVSNLLAGRVAGVNISGGVGNSGSGASIRLRGATSMALSNQPLVYVDGVRTRSDEYPRNGIFQGATQRGANAYGSPLNDINPDDIDRIEVVKGAAATTLFGTDAAAGVIQIFTKRGAQGAPKWTAQLNSGVAQLQQFGTDSVPLLNMDPFVRNASRLGAQAQVAGGTQSNVKYLFSFGADNTNGVLQLDNERKYNLRANIDFSPAKNLAFSWNSSYTNNAITQTPAGNNAQGVTLNAFRQERNYFGNANPDTIKQVYQQRLNSNIDRLLLGATSTWTPLQNFSSRLIVGWDRSALENRNVRPYGFPAAPLGIIQNQQWSNNILSLDWANNLDVKLGENSKLTLSAGTQYISSLVTDVVGYSENYPAPTEPTVASGSLRNADENKLKNVTGGAFTQALVGFKDKYFFTVGARVDGNSAFGTDFGFQTYPKASASWVVSDEGFWSEKLGTLKLRGAYGSAGRAPGVFAAVQTWNPVGWGVSPAVRPQNLGNAALGPERTNELELGFDQTLFGGRFSVDFTWFRAITEDALMNVRTVPSLGFLNNTLQNVGRLQKQGIEAAINGTLVDRTNFGLTAGVNVTTNISKVLSLGGAPSFTIGNFGWVIEGQPAPVLRGRLIRNEDQIGAPVDTAVNHLFGPSQPTLILAPQLNLRTWKGISVSLRGEYQGGAFINEDASFQALSRSVRWPTCARAYAAIAANGPLSPRERLTCIPANARQDMFIFPADFFKLRDVTVTVPLGKFIPGTTSSSFVFSAQNFFRRNYGMPLFDPEMSGNDGFNAAVRYISEMIPAPAMYLTSLRIAF